MKHTYLLKILIALAIIFSIQNVTSQINNTVSSSPSPYCVGLTYTANTGTAIEPGNNYDCLFSQPNPTWFFLKAETSGDITLSLSAPSDIDFIVYGPFDDMNELVSLSGQHGVNTESPVVDCSYSGTNNEIVEIPGMVAGQYYLILITNYASVVQEITLVQTGGTGSLDCSVMNQLFQNISGHAFYDLNQSGTKEADEAYLPNVEIDFAPMNTTQTTNSDGAFSYTYFTEDTIDYTVSASLADWSSIGTNAISFSLDTINSDTTGILFGFYPDSLYYQNTLDLVTINALCAGTNLSWITVQNTGTIMNSGIVELLLDDELGYLSSSYPADSIVGDYVYFSFDSLQPFHSLTIQLMTDPEITMTIDDTVVTVATLTIMDSLLNVADVLINSTAVPALCSYDPNNKIALPNGSYQVNNLIEPDVKLEYIINFQNTGNAPAVNVEIRDDLSELIDETSFEFISSSHTSFVSIDSNRMISFYFPDINLPDSTTNEPMSKGYVKFRVSLVSDVVPNDVVNNQARIYFDNNPPIYTNTAENILNCFIMPPAVNLTYSNYIIETNLTDPNLTFTWLLNGNILSGETNNFIEVTLDGMYTVIVANQYGCEVSGSYSYFNSVYENTKLNAAIYPNPSRDQFGIYLEETGNYEVVVSDETGRLIYSTQILETNKMTIDGSTFDPGIYFIQISSEDGSGSVYRIVRL